MKYSEGYADGQKMNKDAEHDNQNAVIISKKMATLVECKQRKLNSSFYSINVRISILNGNISSCEK